MTRGLGVLVVLPVLAMLVAAGPVAGAAPEAPVTRCALRDRTLDEVSGLAVTPSGPAVVNDSGNATVVYTLAPNCSVASTRQVGVTGRDVEDLARSDGTLWLADIGDNDRRRSNIALIRLPVRGGPTVLRLTYPDGSHDAETLLLPADGRPVIVTKDLGGRSGIYATDVPPTAAATTPLHRVGELDVPLSSTEGGPLGPFGRGLFTGGALSADGRVAAVRTYTDAWLYPVTGGTADDVVAGLRAAPVGVPLPGEPQGEAVAFTADGTLLSAGEAGDSGGTASLRAVPGAAGLVGRAPQTATPAPGSPESGDPPSGPPVVVAEVVVGAVVVLGVLGGVALAVRARRRSGRSRR
ncbi:hypothetical protein LQ327_28220 [Actinomycetospora endophytica]|uniref:Uncharacterized protein n=1 Tax=Actinomycetospora endophytica TaxID=2291215 RepID=A0ABS8PG81_9PSEU|nr:hypothetical protein [Actinomycetospora endophytica]MCD2197264.1 hypothetical protein [Actinomycetospora endophytica]